MMIRKRVLLLSPPTVNGSMIIKDQYCSNTSKAGYYWIPVDLLVLSGDLSDHFELKVLDAIVEKKSLEEVVKEVRDFTPDHIVVLSSILTHHSDRALIADLKKDLSFKTTFIGDVFYFSPKQMIEFSEVDSIIYEYPCPQLVRYIQEGTAESNIVYKTEEKVIYTPAVKETEVKYSTPRHELFPVKRYSVPFMMEKLCTSVLTNFGCKFSCNYCPGSSVNYRERSVEDIISELTHIKSLGINNVWIRDFTFALNKERSIKLLAELTPLKVNWFCLSRSEILEESLLQQMKDSGCYLIMVGVDTINEAAMKQIKRQQNTNELKAKIEQIENKGIFVLSHMIIGLPGDRYRDMIRTIHYLNSSKASFLSINLFAPRTGSAYFNEINIHSEEASNLDSYYGEQASGLQRFFYLMIKNYGMILFYSNPRRLLGIISRIKTRTQLKILLRTGIKMFIPQPKN
ncbi:MAG TPA: B12-binding domain-containing radical SAM protein [Bacteriovoracaceae bacterium]|nr:B12-binding domain-containing radical SAM protein [Bacteriovoracaceae bacterium]